MRLSQLVAKLATDLQVNGDTENVSLCLVVAGTGDKKYRLDAVLVENTDIEVIRDVNYVNGMACVVADY